MAEDEINDENNSLEDRLQALTDQIETEVLKSGSPIWGHGTTREIAEKILREGIIVNPGYSLTEIAIPLNTLADEPAKQAKDIVAKARKWPHKNAKAVVLIELSKGFRPHQVVEKVELDGQERSRIPSRFLFGAIDSNKTEFISNPDHQESPEPTTTGPEFPQIGLSKHFKTESVPIPQPRADQVEDVPDVW